MLETITSGLLGSVFGGVFRLAPEVLKWLDRKNERDHEFNMFRLQTDLEKMRGEYRLEEKYVDHSVAQLDAIAEAFKQQGEADAKAWKWVASMSALVRPGITYILFGMYCAFKVAVVSYAAAHSADWKDLFMTVWTVDDFALLNMIITFWFVGRAIERRNPSN